VFASIEPLAYLVERVGGERVAVEVLVGAGRSPATYEPTPRQLVALGRADIFFRIGVPFERSLVPKIAELAPDLRVVDTRQGLPLRDMPAHHDHEHDHEARDGGEEAGGAPDPHVWLDPILARTQCRKISDELVRADPAHRAYYERNCAGIEEDLEEVHRKITALLAPLRGTAVYVYHPAFGYFTDRYGLKQVPVEVEGKEPSVRRLARLIEQAQEDGVKVIFVQAQFARLSAEKIAAAIGGAVVPVDPLARNYLENLAAMAAAIEAGLRREGGERDG
jgi:zinc transport system substrate-binding protein